MAVNTEEVFKKIEKQNGKMFARVMRGDGSAIPEGSPFRHVNLLDTPGFGEYVAICRQRSK